MALITFIVLAITPGLYLPAGLTLAGATPDQLAAATQAAQSVQVKLLVWIFLMRVMMVLASAGSYLVNHAVAKARFVAADKMNFEAPLTSLVWLTSIVSVVLTYVLSKWIIPDVNGNTDLWWQLSTVITCGTLAGAIIPELVKVFTSTQSRHVREVVTASREGGASLNILAGFVAGNFSAYYLGLAIMALMAVASWVATMGLGEFMKAPAIFAFGLVAFGFLGMGPVTIAVDSYGPVTDNAQSVYELSQIEEIPGIEQRDPEDLRLQAELRRGQGPARGERRRRQHVQGDREAGAHRDRGRRRHDDDLLDHHGADAGSDRRERDQQAVDPAPAVPAGPDHWRRDDLLVHGRVDAGRVDRAPTGRWSSSSGTSSSRA